MRSMSFRKSSIYKFWITEDRPITCCLFTFFSVHKNCEHCTFTIYTEWWCGLHGYTDYSQCSKYPCHDTVVLGCKSCMIVNVYKTGGFVIACRKFWEETRCQKDNYVDKELNGGMYVPVCMCRLAYLKLICLMWTWIFHFSHTFMTVTSK